MVAAKPIKITAKWRKLFKLIPNYDPIVSAGPGDYFDPKAAEKACGFFPECLKHVKGVKAGEPFVLEPWETAIIGCLFGWKRPDGTRRYRECLLYVASKNGKTSLAAGLVLYMLWIDGEMGAEVYSAASSRDQAGLIFAHAVGFLLKSKTMLADLTPYGHKGGSVSKSIYYEAALSAYKCLSADAYTIDGVNVHFAAIDEIHRHTDPELANLLQTKTASRKQPMIFYTTTADHNRPSLCNDKLKYAHAVQENRGDPSKPGNDPAFLPVVFECDKDDDWESPDVWRKANPNMDVTVPESFLRRECKQAKETPSKLNSFKRLHCNIVTETDEVFFVMDKWDKCGGAIDLHDLRGQRCFAGGDLASTSDITALALWFPESLAALLWCWLPRATAIDREKKDGVPYSQWAREGFITLTEGNVTDYEFVRAKINELHDYYGIHVLGMDPHNATHLVTNLQGDGLNVEAFRQGFISMNAPTKELERLVVAGKLNHGDNPVYRWAAGNAVVEMDAAGNIKISKRKSTEKVDPIIALVEAIGVAMVAPGPAVSCYETEDLIVL